MEEISLGSTNVGLKAILDIVWGKSEQRYVLR